MAYKFLKIQIFFLVFQMVSVLALGRGEFLQQHICLQNVIHLRTFTQYVGHQISVLVNLIHYVFVVSHVELQSFTTTYLFLPASSPPYLVSNVFQISIALFLIDKEIKKKKQKIESLCRGISTALKAKFRHNRGAIATTVLLPKAKQLYKNPMSIHPGWRLILCNVNTTILALIPKRLRLVLDKLISPSQNAFVLGRSIGDNILLAQELFAGYNRQGLPMRCALKVDLRKAYDTVEWDFLSAVLQLFGFPGTFIGWVEECVTTLCSRMRDSPFIGGARSLDYFNFALQMTSFYFVKLTWLRFGFLDTGWTNSPNCPSYMLTHKRVSLVSLVQHRIPIEEGGQGIRDILALNKVLMSRHLWNVIQNNQSSIWVKWIAHTRLRHKSVWTVDVKGGSWGWRKILRLRSALLPYIEFKIGDGESFSLWHDPWHSLGSLITRFPRGPGRTNIPEAAKLSAVLVDGDWSWPPITDMECIEILHLLPIIHNGSDSILWRGGNFSTKVVYDIFRTPGPKVGVVFTTFRPFYSRQCIRILKGTVRFSWPNRAWGVDIAWASRRWNDRHIVQAAYRALLAAIVYHIWQEHNRRIFQHSERPSSTVARIVVDEIRQKILSIDLPDSVSSRGLCRLWRIPWPVRGAA
ncbi:UNVERIFIED_CONTAM: putative ribonuclease H protein [Sesamum calycinum]|uniref:Ribonuclease H protein n=1 Tax=Sesamum calycinum TaxID=2727403 RepID=A0AAW2K758_9LAMI